MGDGSWWVDSCYVHCPPSLHRFLLFTFEPWPSSPSLIYRGSPLTPVPLQASVIDDHQHANTAQYFNFLSRKRNLRGWVKFRGTVWFLQLTTSPQSHAEDLRSKHSAENIPETRSSLCQQNNPCRHRPLWQTAAQRTLTGDPTACMRATLQRDYFIQKSAGLDQCLYGTGLLTAYTTGYKGFYQF